MDHPRHLTSIFCLYGKAVAPVPHGDNRVLQIGARGTVHHRIEGAVHLVVHLTHGAANLQKSAAGVVRHGVVREDAAPDFAGKGNNGFEQLERFLKGVFCRIVRLSLSVLFYFSGGLQKRHDL